MYRPSYHRKRIPFAPTTVMIILQLILLAAATDWPMYGRDHSRTGVSDEIVFPPLDLLWKTETEGIPRSSPAVHDGVVYVGAWETEDTGYVIAIDSTTGKLKWKYRTDGAVGTSPAVSDGIVYVGTERAVFYALSTRNGFLKWKYTMGVNDGIMSDLIHSSPVVWDGKVFAGSTNGVMYALDARTGELKWQYKTNSSIGTSPAIADGVLFFGGSRDETIHALNATTGEIEWRYHTGDYIDSSPAVHDGIVYISSGGLLHSINASNGTLNWRVRIGGGDYTPAVSCGIVFIATEYRQVYGISSETSEIIWNTELPGHLSTRPAVSHGIVYVNGVSALFALDGNNGAIRWRANWTTDSIVFGATSPAISDGVVFVGRGQGGLYAFKTHSTEWMVSSPVSSTFSECAWRRGPSSVPQEPESAGCPRIIWERKFGGEGSEQRLSIVLASEGGYLISGETDSYGADGFDIWMIKVDDDGTVQWNRTYGGEGDEGIIEVRRLSEGGYAILGRTPSIGVDDRDLWLIKTDEDGLVRWDRRLIRPEIEGLSSFHQTPDGGFIFAGSVLGKDRNTNDNFLFKTDGNGDEEWNHTYTRPGHESVQDLLITPDDRYLIAGSIGKYGEMDIRLIKADKRGRTKWTANLGGHGYQVARSIYRASDDGYVIAGHTYCAEGSNDILLMKTDPMGKELWTTSFGGQSEDYVSSVDPTSDGGYLLAGSTGSYGADPYNMWLIKTDGHGVPEWNRTFGGKNFDWGSDAVQTPDGGFLIVGTTESYRGSSTDIMVAKLVECSTPDPRSVQSETLYYPTPSPTETTPIPYTGDDHTEISYQIPEVTSILNAIRIIKRDLYETGKGPIIVIGHNADFSDMETANDVYASFLDHGNLVITTDDQISPLDKNERDLILIGGPSVNRLVGELGMTRWDYCDEHTWPCMNPSARIKFIEDGFAPGLKVIVIAGWEAADTRKAARVFTEIDEKEMYSTQLDVVLKGYSNR